MTSVSLRIPTRFPVLCLLYLSIATLSLAQPNINSPGSQSAIQTQLAEIQQRQAQEMAKLTERMTLRDQSLNELEHELYRRQWPIERQVRLTLAPAAPAMNTPSAYPELTLIPSALQPLLRESVSETFYLPLYHLAVPERLSKKQSKSIDEYLSRRLRLVTNLRASVSNATIADGVDEINLAELSALEAESESIRYDLTGGSTSTRLRGIRLAEQMVQNSPKSIPTGRLDAIQATDAACYHNGLSAWQREALLELAIEVRSESGEAESSLRTAKPIFFLPWTARIEAPSGLPSSVQKDLDAFVAGKRKVKDELLATVKSVARKSPRAQAATYRELAARQEPQWVELEAQAETLRRAFQAVGYPAPPPALPASEELTERVAHALLKKTALQRELKEFVQSLRRILPRDKFEIGRQGDTLAVIRILGSEPSSLSAVDNGKVQSAISTTNASFAEKYVPLVRELGAIRAELELVVSRLPEGEKIGVDALANNLLQSWITQQTWPRYADYRAAVLTPGLKPAVRSLLFRAALVDLAPAAKPALKTE